MYAPRAAASQLRVRRTRKHPRAHPHKSTHPHRTHSQGHVESELSRRVRAGSESSSTYEAVQAVMPAAAAREGGGKEGLITKEQFVDVTRPDSIS